MRIVRPTYNRSQTLKGVDYFKGAKYVLPESQRDDYFKVLSSKQMIINLCSARDPYHLTIFGHLHALWCF